MSTARLTDNSDDSEENYNTQYIQYGDTRICYRICFIRKSTTTKLSKVSIHVYPDGSVQVDAPSDTKLAKISEAVQKRARWITTHLEEIRKHQEHVLQREYVSGESHFYRGRRFKLKVEQGADISDVKLIGGQIHVFTPYNNAEDIKKALWEWYRIHARVVFDARLNHITSQIYWIKQAPRWKLLAMKKQWGSCSPNGVLSLNPHLVKAPTPCIDYVILHELCHLREHNHSDKFYQLLDHHMPDWRLIKGRLDGMAELLLNN